MAASGRETTRPKTFNSTNFKRSCGRGIVVFNIPYTNASGHADLWNGKTTIDGQDSDIDDSTSILFWALEGAAE